MCRRGVTRKEKKTETSILLGKYRVIRQLGKNAAHEVFLAEDQTLFIKRVIKCYARDDPGREESLREAAALAACRHPSIPQMYELAEENDRIFLVEEYMEGTSLQTWMSVQTEISIAYVFDIGRQLCDILCYFYEKTGSIYPDLKPEHIVIRNGRVGLVDFGCVYTPPQTEKTTASRDSRITKGWEATGAFAAPEVRCGKMPDRRSEVYGVGAILYFMINRRFYEGQVDVIGDTMFPTEILRSALADRAEDRFEDVAVLKKKIEEKETKTNIGQGVEIPGPSAHSTGQRNLSRLIAVIGSEPHIGVTHFAMMLTCFALEEGYPACYYSKATKNALAILAEVDMVRSGPGGEIRWENFRGNLVYRPEEAEADTWRVVDCGTLRKEAESILEEADRVFVIVGAKHWEQKSTQQAVLRFANDKRAQILANFSDASDARRLSRGYRVDIARIPYVQDPRRPDATAKRFLTALWKMKER